MVRQVVVLLLFVLTGGWLKAEPRAPIDSLRALLQKSKPDTNRVNLLLNLSHAYVFKKGELVSDLDTALVLINQAQSLSQTLHYKLGIGNCYLLSAQAFREKGQQAKGRQLAQQAIALYTQLNNRPKQVEAYLELALSYWINKNELPSKIAYTQQAMTLVQGYQDKQMEASLLKELADFHQIQGNYPQSIAELRQALTILQSIRSNDLTGTYDLLGYVSTKLGDFREGLKYGLMAVKITERDHDTGLLACTVYNRVGLTYMAMGQYEQAYSYFKKSYYIARLNKFNPSIIHLAGNIATVLLKKHQPRQALAVLIAVEKKDPPTQDGSRVHLYTRFVDVYSALNQYSQAQRYCNELLAITPNEGWESIGEVGVYQSLIRFYITSKQFAKADHFLTENDALCRSSSSLTDLAQNHLLWFQRDTTQGHYPSAIAHYQQYIALRDSLLNETKSRQIAQLEIQYEIQKKDNDIQVKEQNIRLLTNRSHLQKTQLQQARTARNSIIAGALLLAGLLGLIYNRYRLKQRSNQLLEAKQLEINQKNRSLEQALDQKDQLLVEKEWMLKEIHHRVKNNLQVITSMLRAQSNSLNDPAALAAIRDSQNRVYAMALLHQKLYQSDNLASVNMPDYIQGIVNYLIDSFDQHNRIIGHIAIADIQFDVALATPIGLIINEAVTNSLKYAFPHNRSGLITVVLQSIANQQYQLTIDDNGIGMPIGFNVEHSRTLGLGMIRGLSRQINGQLKIGLESGVHFTLAFSPVAKADTPMPTV